MAESPTPPEALAYSGRCGHCLTEIVRLMIALEPDERVVPAAIITVGHRCTHPAMDVHLAYEGEVIDGRLAPYLRGF